MGELLNMDTGIERLALGTVQFGMNYGVANKTGKVTGTEVGQILNAGKNQRVSIRWIPQLHTATVN
jgi:hypothetical protein